MKKRSSKLIIALSLILAVAAAIVIIKLAATNEDKSVVRGETTEVSGTTQQAVVAIPEDADGIYASADGQAYYYYRSGNKVLNAGWYDMSDTLKVEVGSDGHAVTKYDSKAGHLYQYSADEGKWVVATEPTYEIDKNTYCFDTDGNLIRSQIAGDDKNGYYFVDSTGCKTTSEEIQMAVDLVMENTDSSMSDEEKLHTCFDKIRSYEYERDYATVDRAAQFSEFAVYAMTNEVANCYKYAAAFACVATVLGHDARVICGQMPAYYGDGLTDHSWTELWDDATNSWLVYDACLQREEYYGEDRAKYFPGESPVDSTAQLMIENGKVTWKWI